MKERRACKLKYDTIFWIYYSLFLLIERDEDEVLNQLNIASYLYIIQLGLNVKTHNWGKF